jgi:subtilisin family serine protease
VPRVLLLLVLLLSAAPAGAAEPRPAACARIAGLSDPAEQVARWADVPAAERRARLIEALRSELLERSRPVRRLLVAAGAERVRVLWIAGVVCADAPAAAWEQVARLPETRALIADAPIPEEALADDATGPNPAVPPEPPLVALRVPEVWAEGFTGRGVTVAVIDTGIELDHPDLADHLWSNPGEVSGNGVDDDGNGYIDDVHGWNFADDNADVADLAGHGTNAAGLLGGDGTAGAQTGVAPDVSLMVVRRGSTQSALWAASQYAVENGAQVVTQSASWKWSFTPDYAGWRRQTDTELAAGVIRTNSGGNTGERLGDEPVPYNVAAPANAPPPWHHPEQDPQAGRSSALGVGNLDARSLGIAPTSPHGPAEWTDIRTHVDPTYPHDMPVEYRDYPVWDGSPGLGKPDLVAPGDGSLTTALGGGYEGFGGTSAATPRVAGILALLLEAVPDATPAELAEAVLATAGDRGPPGRDDRYGAGMPDAAAALERLGPPLRVARSVVHDAGSPTGDGDGDADEGEIVRLELVIANTSASPLGPVELILRDAPGALVRDGYARIDNVPAEGEAATSAPHFGVELRAGSCATRPRLQVEIRHAGRLRVDTVVLPVGTETRTPLLESDFEVAAGFTAAGGATAGHWVREEPVGTSFAGQPANPAADHTPEPGAVAWVTGNGPTDPQAADVDGGTVRLTSAPVDARGYDDVELTYYRWFRGSDPAAADTLLVEARGDELDPWRLVEEVSASETLWRRRHVVLSDLVPPGEATAVRFAVTDEGAEHVVEAGLDDFGLVGVTLACTPWSIPPATPGAIGPTLRLARLAGGHLELTWAPPSASGGSDPPWGYRVERSAAPNGGFSALAWPAIERHVEVDGLSAGPREAFYLVVPLEGPVP